MSKSLQICSEQEILFRNRIDHRHDGLAGIVSLATTRHGPIDRNGSFGLNSLSDFSTAV
jgi:hypothetical protein